MSTVTVHPAEPAMKLICDRERLLSAFQLAANVAPSRSPKPILENVKLEAADQTITLTATDLEIGIRTEVPGIEIDAPGAVVLPVKRVGPILRESSDEKLTLESDGSKLRIRGDRSEFNLPTQNPDEFPVVSSFSEEKYHKLPARPSASWSAARSSPPTPNRAATPSAACSWK